jgi:MoxR-like ATPase
MSPSEHWQLYSGTGVKRGRPVPPATDLEPLTRAEGYLADEGLAAAVNVALALGQPLLITGEPGTGKTQLAYSVAHELGLPLFRFDTKTTSSARDLFYRYDALRHFQAAHAHDGSATAASAKQFIEFEALGRAILLAMGAAGDGFPSGTALLAKPQRSVVLVDEIDKAPRDLPNDLLNEVEEMRFTIRETGDEIPARHAKVDRAYRPILILTSNSEKNLPDAFLRRCVYYHVPVPSPERLTTIVARRLGIAEPPRADASDGAGVTAPAPSEAPADRATTILSHAVQHFVRLRDAGLKKKPATAELIAWVRMLVENEIDLGAPLTAEQKRTLGVSYSILAKTREDLETMSASGGAAR